MRVNIKFQGRRLYRFAFDRRRDLLVHLFTARPLGLADLVHFMFLLTIGALQNVVDPDKKSPPRFGGN